MPKLFKLFWKSFDKLGGYEHTILSDWLLTGYAHFQEFLCIFIFLMIAVPRQRLADNRVLRERWSVREEERARLCALARRRRRRPRSHATHNGVENFCCFSWGPPMLSNYPQPLTYYSTSTLL